MSKWPTEICVVSAMRFTGQLLSFELPTLEARIYLERGTVRDQKRLKGKIVAIVFGCWYK